MKNKALLIGAALMVGYFIYSVKEFAANVKTRITGVKFNEAKTKSNLFTQVWLDIGLQISNPSSFETTLNSIVLDIYFNRRKVGTVEKYGDIRLNPMSENNIIIPAVIPTFSLFATIAEAVRMIKATLKREGQPISLGFRGVIKTTSGSIQIDETQTITPL